MESGAFFNGVAGVENVVVHSRVAPVQAEARPAALLSFFLSQAVGLNGFKV